MSDVKGLLHSHGKSLASPEVYKTVQDDICLANSCIDFDGAVKIIGDYDPRYVNFQLKVTYP